MPRASARRSAVHAGLGLGISFGLSILFWIGLGVFDPAGFLIWSTIIGAAGAALGTWRRSLAVTAIATAVIRVVHFALMMHVL